jgi:hypothetical protein
MDASEEGSEEPQQQVHLTLSQLPALVTLLQAIKIGAKQVGDGWRASVAGVCVCARRRPTAAVRRSVLSLCAVE